MVFHPTDLIGYGAALLTMVSSVPQVWLRAFRLGCTACSPLESPCG